MFGRETLSFWRIHRFCSSAFTNSSFYFYYLFFIVQFISFFIGCCIVVLGFVILLYYSYCSITPFQFIVSFQLFQFIVFGVQRLQFLTYFKYVYKTTNHEAKRCQKYFHINTGCNKSKTRILWIKENISNVSLKH